MSLFDTSAVRAHQDKTAERLDDRMKEHATALTLAMRALPIDVMLARVRNGIDARSDVTSSPKELRELHRLLGDLSWTLE